MAFTGQLTFERKTGGFETSNGTIATALTVTLVANGTYSVTVEMNAKDTSSGKSIKGIKSTTFERVGGTTTQVATSLVDLVTTLVSDAVNNAGALWTVDNSGDDIRIRVTGNIGRSIHWQYKLEISMN